MALRPPKSSAHTFGKLGALLKRNPNPAPEDLDEIANQLLFSSQPGRRPALEYPPLSPRQLESRRKGEQLLGGDVARVTRYPLRDGLHGVG